MGNARVFISSVFDHRLKDPWGGDMLRGGSRNPTAMEDDPHGDE